MQGNSNNDDDDNKHLTEALNTGKDGELTALDGRLFHTGIERAKNECLLVLWDSLVQEVLRHNSLTRKWQSDKILACYFLNPDLFRHPDTGDCGTATKKGTG